MIRALIVCFVGLGSPLVAQRIHLSPVDQAEKDPTLTIFRTQLLTDIIARDTEAVVAASCNQIYLSHGGNGGHDEFRHNLTLPEESLSEEYRPQADALREAYWKNLQKTLQQPGYFADSAEFLMPFHWQIDLPDEIDIFEAYFVNGRHVALRQSADSKATILEQISHEVVTIAKFDENALYQHVTIGDSRTGYMHRDYLWPIVGYRASLTKTANGDWQLCSFVAGD
ncbi:SH3 domain-containing protein [Parasedimentitalea huanghaiensis]|uniref:SH3 domain-containing protein n=1 Tax=Parasedimentitalea huanghaiensis TaxID=2682100 RepID=A0A6L6WEK9_9RHOB|nr:SH3 domain-containing protein [Zongyanglinia huanghaiensis]MVO14447.1 SH3 domain-containing protein [Zongyanglinia huanghaiensis]